jgi:hypothetical protein
MTTQMCSDAAAAAIFTSVGQVIYNGGENGGGTPVVKTNFLARPQRQNWVQVIWGGQHCGGGNPDQIQPVIDIVNAIGHGDFLVIGGVNDGHTAAWQGPSGARYIELMAFHAALQAEYPDNFLDLHGILVADGIANEDENSVLYDAPPAYFAPTDIHFNSDGYVRAAEEILAKVEAMGLTTQGALNRQIARSGGR